MRLQNQVTLAYYLQEVSAESVLPKLSAHAREKQYFRIFPLLPSAPCFPSALAATPVGLFLSCWPVLADGVSAAVQTWCKGHLELQTFR